MTENQIEYVRKMIKDIDFAEKTINNIKNIAYKGKSYMDDPENILSVVFNIAGRPTFAIPASNERTKDIIRRCVDDLIYEYSRIASGPDTDDLFSALQDIEYDEELEDDKE